MSKPRELPRAGSIRLRTMGVRLLADLDALEQYEAGELGLTAFADRVIHPGSKRSWALEAEKMTVDERNAIYRKMIVKVRAKRIQRDWDAWGQP